VSECRILLSSYQEIHWTKSSSTKKDLSSLYLGMFKIFTKKLSKLFLVSFPSSSPEKVFHLETNAHIYIRGRFSVVSCTKTRCYTLSWMGKTNYYFYSPPIGGIPLPFFYMEKCVIDLLGQRVKEGRLAKWMVEKEEES